MAIAYCWRSGQIEIGATIPEGALPLMQGLRREVEEEMIRASRLAYDGSTLLVPGVPEADDDDAAFAAYQDFRAWLESRAANRAVKIGEVA